MKEIMKKDLQRDKGNEVDTINKSYKISVSGLSLFFLILWMIVGTTKTAYAQEISDKSGKVVRVATFGGSYIFTNEEGEHSGYGYEFHQAVSAYTGWNYDYVTCTWLDCFEKIEAGEIDIMGGVSYTEDRAKTMLFSDLPMGEERYYLYTDLVKNDISAVDLKTLNGKRVGVLEQSTPERLLYEWEKKHNLDIQHVNIISTEDALEKIQNQEIDCFISTEAPKWGNYGFSAVTSIGSSDIYFVINQNRRDLKDELDSSMRRIEHDRPFFKEDLYKRFLSTNSYEILTDEEKRWLNQHGTIRIGYLKSDKGISLVDEETGNPVGIINDYIDYASDCLGNGSLTFELTGFDTQEGQLRALKENQIDVIFHVNQNSNKAEQNGIILSNTVFEINTAVITKKDYFDEEAENIVAVSRDNLLSKWYLAESYPQWKIYECDSSGDVTEAVRNGTADCFVVKAGQSASSQQDKEIHSIFLTKASASSFAVTKQNTILLSILNKTLNTIPISKLSGAYAMYENTRGKVSLEEFIEDNLRMVIVVIVGFFIVISLIFLYLLIKARKAQQEAECANVAKTNFLFNMSHDIRTPMNALLGYNMLMKKELTDPKLLDYQEKIEQSGKLLLSIINNILDMARIESGKVELDESYAEASDILKEIHGVFEVEAKKKNIRYIHKAYVEHTHIMCDVTKIQEILVNLVSNAIKYTPNGGKVVVISREIPGAKSGYVRIKTEVIDNGIGMSKDFLPNLYEPFARERNTTTGKIAGTGLGMPIIKKYVEVMGGSIEVESELGKGSKFTVILEHRIADRAYYEKNVEKPSDSDEKKKTSISGKRILMAEDNDLNAEIAITILEDLGVKVERVSDGIQCVAKMEQMPAGSYDLIFMDVQMPNMDGYKATQEIRSMADEKKAKIPIIAMTANAFEEDKKVALSKGMNGHIAKPIDGVKIEEVMRNILGSEQ